MKYTLLTAAALATIAIAAPAPEKALSLRGLGLGDDGSDNKAFVDGDYFILKLSVEYLRDALSLDKNTIEVPTKSKAKVKRGHHQGGAQLLNILNVLSGDVLGNTDAIGNILVGIGNGDITRADGTRQCHDLLQVIAGLLDGVTGGLTSFPRLGGNDYNRKELIRIVKPIVSGLTKTVNNVVRTLGVDGGSVGGGQIGGDDVNPVTSSLTNFLKGLLRIDNGLGPILQDILNSVLGGVGAGTGTGTGTGTGLLGGLLGNVLRPVKGLLNSINVEAEVEIGGEEEEEEEEGEEESTGGNGSSGSGSESSGSGNESPVYNVPT